MLRTFDFNLLKHKSAPTLIYNILRIPPPIYPQVDINYLAHLACIQDQLLNEHNDERYNKTIPHRWHKMNETNRLLSSIGISDPSRQLYDFEMYMYACDLGLNSSSFEIYIDEIKLILDQNNDYLFKRYVETD
jgi:hypothetical protein